MAKFRRHGVRTLGYEIERRAKTQLHLEFSKLFDAVDSLLAFDIVGKHKGKTFAIWPTSPSGRTPFGSWQNWPNTSDLLPLALGKPPANTQADRSRNQRLYAKIKAM